MTTEQQQLQIGGIDVEVVRKEIKNLHVGVYPPTGRVRVAAPRRLGDEAVRLAIISRLGWIRRQRAAFESQLRQSERELVSGESQYYRGRRYLLHVEESKRATGVRLAGRSRMVLTVRPGSGRTERDVVLQRWYRQQLRDHIPPVLEKWQERLGEAVDDVRIKRMRTRWGSCNAEARRIWLNVELIKKSPSCLEYVLLHEMVHLVERRHGDRFRNLMDQLMPTWRFRRDTLNRAPLAHEDWAY